MKKTTAIFCIIILTFFTVMNASASLLLEYDGAVHEYNGSIYTLSVNGKKISTPLEPIIFNSRALVPVREVFEATGAFVNYNSATKGIYIEGNGIKILMSIGNDKATVNGTIVKFTDGVSPKLIAKKGESAKTMVPVRFISEALGYSVNFTGKSIEINTNSQASLNDVYMKSSSDTVMISIKANSALERVTGPVLTSSGVLYVDIYNAKNNLPSSIKVNRGAVEKVRTGTHDEYTRIALDVTDLRSYSMKLSQDKKTVMITTIKMTTDEKKEKIVVIDPGHGGSDGGAGVNYDGTYIKEKDINLAIATKTVDILRKNGVKVEMTRTGDTYPELTERSSFANSIDAAVFVSIHANSADATSANGVEVYYASENNSDAYGVKSQELADKILNAIIAYTGANNRRVKTERHVVTRTSNMPAALVEVGFITNEEELKNLLNSDYQYKVASGIAEGIMKCLPSITLTGGNRAVFGENDLGEKIR